MILKSEALSPAQKSAIEQILGRQIVEAETISLRVFTSQPPDLQRQHAAIERLRAILDGAGRPRSGVTDEELESALLEAIRSERPSYTPVE